MSTIDVERHRREEMWSKLIEHGGPTNVAPVLLRQLGFYGGAAGIWVNKSMTRAVDPSGNGITVGLLHTGSAYPDDLDDTGVLYHYPSTNRPVGHDHGEIVATKVAGQYQLPLFVITHSTDQHLRDVHRGYVIDFDDEAKVFLVSFYGEDAGEPLPTALEEDQTPFSLIGTPSTKKRTTSARDGQPGFKFRVFRRYGSACAVCPITVSELLDAAHVREKRDQGSDDARNGIVLCVTHHRAYDRGFFGFEPSTLRVALRGSMQSSSDLGITNDSILHLRLKPHEEALQWRWNKWQSGGKSPNAVEAMATTKQDSPCIG